jgi:hypothetical protein
MAIAKAANLFVDRLSPADRVAVAGFGVGAPATVFTADRERVKRVIARMVGQKHPGRMLDLGHNIALVEAQAIERGDQVTYATVLNRECPPAGMSPMALEVCRQQVEMEAKSLAQEVRIDADQTISNLRDLLLGLSRIDAPKTMILISEGFVLSDEAMIIDLGTLAAQARTSVYTLKLDNALFEITDARMPINPFRRPPGADRRTRTARRRGPRHAVHGHRHGTSPVRAYRVGALRLLPDRRGIGIPRPRRKIPFDSGRCAAAWRAGPPASSGLERQIRSSGARAPRARRSSPRSAHRCCRRRFRCASRRSRCRDPRPARCRS